MLGIEKGALILSVSERRCGMLWPTIFLALFRQQRQPSQLSVRPSVGLSVCLPAYLSACLPVCVIKEAAERIRQSRNAIALDNSRLTIYKHTAVNNYTET